MMPIPGYLGAIASNGPVSLMVPSTITTAPSGITPDAPRHGSVIAYAPRMRMVSVIALHPCNSARPRSRRVVTLLARSCEITGLPRGSPAATALPRVQRPPEVIRWASYPDREPSSCTRATPPLGPIACPLTSEPERGRPHRLAAPVALRLRPHRPEPSTPADTNGR